MFFMRGKPWLHGVSTEELPAGQEILEEIGAHLRALHSQDWIGAKNQFLYIFVRSQNRDGYVPYHAQQTALSELIAINEQIWKLHKYVCVLETWGPIFKAFVSDRKTKSVGFCAYCEFDHL